MTIRYAREKLFHAGFLHLYVLVLGYPNKEMTSHVVPRRNMVSEVHERGRSSTEDRMTGGVYRGNNQGSCFSALCREFLHLSIGYLINLDM